MVHLLKKDSGKMSIQSLYPSPTAYYTTGIVNNFYLDVLNYRAIPKLAGDVYFTITTAYEFRPDLLAHDLYSDSRLWWVFAARNPNTLGDDPYFNFTTGTSIYIPTLTTIQTALGI